MQVVQITDQIKKDQLIEQKTTSEDSLSVVPKPYFSSFSISLFLGNAETILSHLATASIDCIVTSPPYYGKRDYKVTGQLGLESHPQTYIDTLIRVFRQAKRVLKPS